ncbi:probable homogentisate 1,2-dioxygenase (HmgA) [Cephalotrichum gorgonifer]|uniref:homogentisate 1,2-dioxygenase n=1 Tax=Cephalotrichum gorgonifer TaxID=2041049 RepID=A0AAE8SY24_9PEZI|nr:probable homogentisate 1,2-dioxygenase (HmgA) [Cephalotrichum gorgonifer]
MLSSKFQTPEKYEHQSGFGSYHETEAVKGALPIGMNSPQEPPFGLYAEKLSGTAFTAPRHENQQSWLYRILPAAAHEAFEPLPSTAGVSLGAAKVHQIPNQLRWDPFDFDEEADWVNGLNYISGCGDPATKTGLAIYIFAVGKDMINEAFYSADGDFLIVPQHGALDIQTELGHLLVRANEICVIPRGVRYRVILPEGPARGYICELFQGHYQLPELGPIGSNGLANARDFLAPVAAYDEDLTPWIITAKFNNTLFRARQDHTPFDVVAWHGNYYPYKYDLGRFCTIGSISFDHPDPSIFTVLTGPSNEAGTAIADFVIFPPRWLVQEATFRPPWYHRNTMSEFMGLIAGDYDAKVGGGFRPAGASLHNIMSAHGPDAATHQAASKAELKPTKVGSASMAFMFESCLMLGVSEWGLKTCKKNQPDYQEVSWTPLKSNFRPPEKQ